MNKFKKIATAVVATVMAGTMVASLAACGPTNDDKKPNGPDGAANQKIESLLKHMNDNGLSMRATTNANAWTRSKSYWDYLSSDANKQIKDEYHVLKTDGTLDYNVYKDRGNVELKVAIGHNNTETAISYQTTGAEITLPDGIKYPAKALKPAWKAMGTDLNITWTDVYAGKNTGANLSHIIDDKENPYATVDMFTTDLSVAVEKAAAGTDILNLADYLDYMPNFKAFLNENPVVYLSLIQGNMNATTGENQSLYVAPYFDGNDDIERYCLIRHDWADKLLNGTDNLAEAGKKYSEACATKTSVESYMGKTGKVEVESGKGSTAADATKVTIVKNYDAALAAAKNDTTPLGAAYKAIANVAYTGDSGNIVDIMNAALAANIDATGSQLVALFRAYIDVCYEEKGQTGSYYTAETRSKLFTGLDACWDVDDMVAMLRCVMTNGDLLTGGSGNTIYGIVPRDGTNDRTPDMVRLAAQFYGVRGADSRYEYTYIDKDGNLKDARQDKEFYEAFNNMHKLVEEGLIADYSGIANFKLAGGYAEDKTNKTTTQAFMMHDYNQTQTKNNYYTEPNGATGVSVDANYYFAPIINPVAKWSVNGDDDTIMRFTESWRSTKTGGLALNGNLKKDTKKLAAALQFVDYLYSEDGQIVSTYGPMATNESGAGGFWYNEEATAAQVTAGKYFTYKGVKYAGTDYKGKITPTITDSLYDSFLGKTVNNFAISSNEKIKGGVLSFTDYARRIIGSTLPVGVKDQSLENQLTARNAREGANIVGIALDLGVLHGMTLEINSNNWWYTCVPTGMPSTTQELNNVLNNTDQLNLKYMTGTNKDNKNHYSVFNHIILKGLTGTYSFQDVTYPFGN